MRKTIRVMRVVSILCFMALLLSVTGVYGVWHYTQAENVNQITEEFPVRGFPWEGSEILPGGTGNNHALLIQALVNSENGLNTAGSALNESINDRWTSSSFWDPSKNTVGSMAMWDGGELDALFGAQTENLEFLLYFVDENKDKVIDYYYVFTVGLRFADEPRNQWDLWGEPYIPYGQKIYPIYRTKVEKNAKGQWEATETDLGRAPSAKYDAGTVLGGWTDIPSFNPDPNQWETITESSTMGKSKADPIWTYAGLENTVTTVSSETVVYYAISPQSSGTYTLTSAQPGCRFTVINASSGVTAVSGPSGTTWNATSGTVYYIAVSGATSITFTVTKP